MIKGLRKIVVNNKKYGWKYVKYGTVCIYDYDTNKKYFFNDHDIVPNYDILIEYDYDISITPKDIALFISRESLG